MSAPSTDCLQTGGAAIRQLASHANLLYDASQTSSPPTGRPRRAKLDAIIVPAARPASALNNIISLAAFLEIEIVVLCSRQANSDRVAERIDRIPGARGIAVDIDSQYELPDQLSLHTSSDFFFKANGGRTSDLSVKRNLGLLLARLRGWRKVVFVDDDVSLSAAGILRLSDQLDNYQIVGMMCREFPDNSVLCHAHRLARIPQDVFVTGAVLGVNCSDLPLPFFPDIYNEDWFFFVEAVVHHRLAKVGEARQAAYNPYQCDRAQNEEFGDLLAEGLYWLIQNQPSSLETRRPGDLFPKITKLATPKYWTTFIDVRRQDLHATRSRLEEFSEREHCSDDVFAAIRALTAADSLYDGEAITSDACAEFLNAWVEDMATWNAVYSRTGNLSSTRDVMDRLKVRRWTAVR